MVQNCVDAASSDFNSYNSKKTRDAADVVGTKSLSITNPIPHHIQTLGSMQPSSVELLSKFLQNSGQASSMGEADERILSDGSENLYRTHATISSSSSSGYESSLSRSSKSNRSWFTRLKRLISFPSTKKSSDYSLSTAGYTSNEVNASPMMTLRQGHATNSINNNDPRRQSLTRLDIRRKSGRRALAPAVQHIPFLYGLKNCGNTCFINATVQCLCHTGPLARYVLTKSYENDMKNVKNALVQHQNSTSPIPTPNFKVTKSFVQIFQALWNNSSNTTSKLLYDFKSIIGNLNRQYAGNEQNDAQEFLLFLINTIHDELNLAANARCRSKTKTSFSSSVLGSQSTLSSVELARRAWFEYADANHSIITNTFSAQLHSTLRCNKCKKESKTFEPYLLLSLPIPQKMIKPVFVTVVFLNQSPKQLQIGLCLPVSSTVRDVREAIAQQSNLDPTDLALVEILQQQGFSQVFHDSEPMSRLTGDVYAIQFPSSTVDSNENSPSNFVDSVSSPPTTNNLFVNLLVLNRVRMASGRCERFGAPIAIRLPRESTYRALQLSIIKAQRSLISDEAMQWAQDFVLFHLSLIDHYQSNTSINNRQEYPIAHDVQWPLYLEKIVEILDMYDGPGLGPSHIQVYATWQEKYSAQFISRRAAGDDKPDVHQSVAQARAALHQPSTSTISLADCFSLFTQSESLNYDDAWMCTHCRRKENGTVKNLKISTLPSVLIIHLKRFCQTKLSNAKLVYPVQFPLIGLDVRRFLSTNRTDESVSTNDSGAEDDQDLMSDLDDGKQYGLYDLYAVCNHRGSMSNGHYTAYCKNPITNKWFCYDDHLVSEIDPSRVCTPDAYILFYSRRDCDSSATSNSVQSSLPSAIEATAQDFDDRLNLEETATIDDKNHWSTMNKEKSAHYTLEPPLPLPRRFVPPTNEENSNAPCPLPRTRRLTIEEENSDFTNSQRNLAPSPAVRKILPSSQNSSFLVNNFPTNQFVEPLPTSYSTTNRSPKTFEQPNPWNRYNNIRYSDEEPEANVVYSRAILR